MDRIIVYPGAIPLDTDLLSINRNTMIALGFLMRATLGTGTVVDGLACTPTVPASMSVQVMPGSLVQMSVVDATPYGSLSADTADPLVKMGINLVPQYFVLQAPVNSGYSVNYLIQACLQESDQHLIVLPYYNAASPSQPYSGPANSGLPQATLRSQSVQLQLKTGVASSTGTQLTPAADQGWVGLYTITVAYGQTTIVSSNITTVPTAPFVTWKLPRLHPGFGSGVQSFQSSGTFVVPLGVSQLEVELWGGGSGCFASVPTMPSGGGAGGGYARKLIQGVLPGQAISVTVGNGGAAGTTAGSPAGTGGTSSFGQFVSATGGSLNYLATVASPVLGATPAGTGINGDLNLPGSAGQDGILNIGGMGGGAPMGGSQNSGTTGVAGSSPGGGAAGAGTGANSATPYAGAAGASGLVIVRW
jgi:glycine rich protein